MHMYGCLHTQGRSGGTLQGADDMLMGGEEDALQAEYEEAAAGLSQRRREGSVRASSVGGDEDEEVCACARKRDLVCQRQSRSVLDCCLHFHTRMRLVDLL